MTSWLPIKAEQVLRGIAGLSFSFLYLSSCFLCDRLPAVTRIDPDLLCSSPGPDLGLFYGLCFCLPVFDPLPATRIYLQSPVP